MKFLDNYFNLPLMYGTFASGIFSLLEAISSLYVIYSGNPEINNKVIFTLLCDAATVISSVLLLIGAKSNLKKLLLPWVIIFAPIGFGRLILIKGSEFKGATAESFLYLLLWSAMGLGSYIYHVMIVIGHYLEMDENDNKPKSEARKLPNVVPQVQKSVS